MIYGVMRTRLDYIEKKLDKHNNVAERVYKLEADSSKILEKISVENNRIKDRRLRKHWGTMHRLTYTRRTGTLLKTWVKVAAR